MLFFFTGTLSEKAVNFINKQNDWCGMALSGMSEQVTNESVGTQDTVSTDCIQQMQSHFSLSPTQLERRSELETE